jgi:hypothetical protein
MPKRVKGAWLCFLCTDACQKITTRKFKYVKFYTILDPPKTGDTVPLLDTGISLLYYKVKKIHKVDKVPEFSFDDGLVYDLVYHHSTVSPDPDLNKIIARGKK